MQFSRNTGQLSRDERVQLYGIDCDDQIVWHEWTPGIESVHNLELMNVALVTQKLKFKLPPTKEFDMPYPEPFKLAPGMKKSIPISFRPSKYEPHVDQVEILTKGGTFFVTVKAVVKDIAITIPHFIDFGLCPTFETSTLQVDVFNTGTLKAAVKWHARQPFAVQCPKDTIEVGEVLRCVVEFEPETASVFDAYLMCEVSKISDTGAVDDDAVVGTREVVNKDMAGSKRYAMQVTGVGKVAHLCVPLPDTPAVEFGAVFPGNRPSQQLRIMNMTPVRATFKVRPVTENGEVAPIPPTPFTVSPDVGTVEPSCGFTLNFTFQSHTVKEFACQRFQITTPGGTPLVVTCTAFCRPMEVRLSTRSVNFGEVACGKIHSRTLQLQNNSDRQAVYHFINADNCRGVFWFDRYMGVIPPNSFMVVTVFFGPLAPINYYKHIFCVIKGAVEPIPLDLIGSSHTEKSRPAFLEQHHTDIFRNMQLNGVREHPPPPEESTPQDGGHSDDDFAILEPEQTLDVSAQPPSATAAFLEMMLPVDSQMRDITISPSDLDFGSCSVLTMSDKQVVTLTNRTSQKVSVCWMLPGESRLACTPDEKALFSVYPVTCDIKPRASAEFLVSFKPQNDSSYEGEFLEVVVYQKVNRSFRLVDLNRFTPPWMLAIRGMGHTMGGTRNDPRLDISESNIRFRACYPGQRTYQAACLTNPGDTCISYRILPPLDTGSSDATATLSELKDNVPFRAWPTQGIIAPHQFHLVILEFAPMVARNERAFSANFPIVVDYNENQPKTLRVAGRAWDPKLTFCHGQPTATFPPTCSGIASNMVCEIKNVSEIPVSYECKIPTRFRNVFWFAQPTGQLQPSEAGSIVAHFCPSSETTFSAPMYCVAKAMEDPDNVVEGPLRSLMANGADAVDTAPTYVLQFVGHGKGPALSLDPDYLDLGAVKANDEVKRPVTLLNSSSLTVHYSIAYEFVEQPGSQPASVGEQALHLDCSNGSVAGRCTETFNMTFSPPCRGLYEYRIMVTPLGDQSSPGGRSILLTLRADVQYPYVQIADLRTESSTLQPQSMMWTQFAVDGINELYHGEVTEVERRFQAAIGIDEKKQLVKQLSPFQLLFGTSAAGSVPTVVYVVLSNPGQLKMRFSFQTPKNLNLENAPYWCDEKAMVDDREAHFSWVEEHGIYDIQPRSGEIPAGDFLHVKLTYHHHSIGTHILPVVFNVHDGRSVLLYLKAHSVAPNVGCLSVRSSVVQLQPVPLNAGEGPMQPVELTNSGGVAAHWRIDKESLYDFNQINYDFEVLKVFPAEGVLESTSSTNLHFVFTPLEAKSYACPVRIEMLKDGRPAEELCFELRADGYDPAAEKAAVEPYFPPNLPIQTYAPVPGCGAALSIEILDFEQCPLRAKVSRMLVLVNYSTEHVLTYHWEPRQLFHAYSELEIQPRSGELSPGSHCIIVFRLCCAKPADISGEIACFLDWTHISSYGQRSMLEDEEENVLPRVEYFAVHSDHVHEPMRAGKAFLSGNDQHHISVVNRLTVSRFRNLMSTAAGQKFLNENLHRTALLASHIQTMSPRKALQASTMSRTSGMGNDMRSSMSGVEASRGAGPGQYSTPPTSYPLYVRIRAVVADWEVPRERFNEFLIASPLNFVGKAGEEEEDMDHTRRKKQTSGMAGQSASAGLNASLMRGVLEHMIREVIAEDDFGAIVDGILAQDAPLFLQYEDSPPPGDPQPPGQGVAEEELSSGSRDFSGYEALKALLGDRPEPEWNSEILMDFDLPPGFERSPTAGDAEGGGAGSAAPAAPEPPLDATAGTALDATSGSLPDLLQMDEDMSGDVEVDLEAFKSSAGEVLDKMLLDMMDDVIAGKLNWTRPMPRVRTRGSGGLRSAV